MTEPRFILDSNICIYLLESKSRTLDLRVEQCAPGELVTSAIAFAEVARGIDWADAEDARIAANFFTHIPVLPFDQAAAREYAALPFTRHRYDRLIAAHARALGVILITANLKDYRDVTDLKVEDWTQ